MQTHREWDSERVGEGRTAGGHCTVINNVIHKGGVEDPFTIIKHNAHDYQVRHCSSCQSS